MIGLLSRFVFPLIGSVISLYTGLPFSHSACDEYSKLFILLVRFGLRFVSLRFIVHWEDYPMSILSANGSETKKLQKTSFIIILYIYLHNNSL